LISKSFLFLSGPVGTSSDIAPKSGFFGFWMYWLAKKVSACNAEPLGRNMNWPINLVLLFNQICRTNVFDEYITSYSSIFVSTLRSIDNK
jgi:hypothetical protein